MATIGEIRAVLQPVIVALRRNAVDGRVENAKQVIAGAMTDTTGRRLRQCIEWLHDLGFLRVPPGKTFGYVDMSRTLSDSELDIVRVPRAKRKKPTAFIEGLRRLNQAAANFEGEALVWADQQLTLGSEWLLTVEGQGFTFQVVDDVARQPNRPNIPFKVPVRPGLGIEEVKGAFVRREGGKTQKLSVVLLFAYYQEGHLRRIGRQ